jgi:hypothetical protein
MSKHKDDAPETQEKTTLPAESNPKRVEDVKVKLSEHVARALGVSRDAVLVERGEVESVVDVNGKKIVVGNEEVSEA